MTTNITYKNHIKGSISSDVYRVEVGKVDDKLVADFYFTNGAFTRYPLGDGEQDITGIDGIADKYKGNPLPPLDNQ